MEFILLKPNLLSILLFCDIISGIRPHAVRKRTPRVPISYSIGKDNGGNFFSSARQDSKQMVDTTDVTHKIALALAEASQRGGSSKKIGSPNKKNMPSPNMKIGKKVISYIYNVSYPFVLFYFFKIRTYSRQL